MILNPVSGVFANYVYNSLLTGRPYFLQMMEDTEIVSRFLRSHLKVNEIRIRATADARMLAREIVETLPGIKPKSNDDVNGVRWSELSMRNGNCGLYITCCLEERIYAKS